MNNENHINWHHYKKEILLFLGSFIFAIVIVVTFWISYQNAGEIKLSTSQEYDELSQDVRDAVEGKTLLKEVGVSFKLLKSQGFYGDEDRLGLTETLKKAADKLKLPSFKYSISPQQRIKNVGADFSRRLALLESIVTFEGGLLHEADFLHIVNELDSFAEGSFIVNACQLVREPSLTLFEITKNVGISCNLSFYTVNISEKEIEEEEFDEFGDEI
jgi:hypothetical protein